MVDETGTGAGNNGLEGYRRLNRKSIVSMYIGNAITFSVLLAIIATVLIAGNEIGGSLFNSLIIIAVAATILLLAYLIASPLVYYSRYRYKITESKVDVRYGVLILRHIMVPIERVHQVEVSRGPINNMLGLGRVNITTAGGVATINYLELDEAEKVADRLNDLVGAMIRGRE